MSDDDVTKKQLNALKDMLDEMSRLKAESDALLDKMRAELRRHEEHYPQKVERPRRG